MNALLMGLGLALLCAVRAVEDQSAHEKLQGIWHVIGVASNCTCIQKLKGSMKMVAVSVNFRPDGSINIDTSFPTPNGCKKFGMTFEKTGTGHYVHKSDKWGEHTVDDWQTDGENWAIAKVTKTKDGETCIAVGLFAKSREVPKDTEEKFLEFAKKYGLPEEEVQIMPKEVVCIED